MAASSVLCRRLAPRQPQQLLRAGSFLALLCQLRSGSAVPFQCHSDIALGPVHSLARKGLALDDATLRGCPSKVPGIWPNAAEPVKSLRLFKAWDPQWPDGDRVATWEHLKRFTHEQNAKILIGTQVTCLPEADDQDWAWVKQLVKMLGPDHVMGVAIGNELDLLWHKAGVDNTVTSSCINDLWAGERLWEVFQSRVAELDSLGLGAVPVTSVFTGAALAGNPFQENANGMVNTFLERAVANHSSRFVFTFNFYPYFDPSKPLDPGTTDQCSGSLREAVCFSPNCNVPSSVAMTRGKIQQIAGSSGSLLWVGETGWSSPKADTLHTTMAQCPAWSSEGTFKTFYEGFLGWDLQRQGVDVPDHAFYFTLRDSTNFGEAENFGLMSRCWGEFCKLRSPDYKGPSVAEARKKELPWMSRLWLGAAIAAAAFSLCCATCLALRRRTRRAGEQERAGIADVAAAA